MYTKATYVLILLRSQESKKMNSDTNGELRYNLNEVSESITKKESPLKTLLTTTQRPGELVLPVLDLLFLSDLGYTRHIFVFRRLLGHLHCQSSALIIRRTSHWHSLLIIEILKLATIFTGL